MADIDNQVRRNFDAEQFKHVERYIGNYAFAYYTQAERCNGDAQLRCRKVAVKVSHNTAGKLRHTAAGFCFELYLRAANPYHGEFGGDKKAVEQNQEKGKEKIKTVYFVSGPMDYLLVHRKSRLIQFQTLFYYFMRITHA